MLKKLQVLFLTTVISGLFISWSAPRTRTITCSVLRVFDGDTVKCVSGAVIRLYGIDAFENDQSCLSGNSVGQKGREYLKTLLDFESVHIEVHQIGRYGRIIGTLYQGNKNINIEVVKSGLALLYKFNSYKSKKEKTLYLSALSYAMDQRLGVWSCAKTLSPYAHRRLKN